MVDADYADPILRLLAEQEALDADQISDLAEEHDRNGKAVRNLVVDMGFMTEDELLEIIASYLGSRVINLPATDIPPDVYHSVPASVARMYNIIPVAKGTNSVELAASTIIDPQVTDELMFVLTRDVTFVMAREEDVKNCINQFYGDDSAAVTDMLSAFEKEMEAAGETFDKEGGDEDIDSEEQAGSAPVIRFVNLVLYQAVNDRGSDIHFEPFEKEFKIRYRVDGALYEMAPPPKRLALPIISRIKVMSGLNIAERRLPQDGRISLKIAGRAVDVRVSTMPSGHGERVVLRLLDKQAGRLNLASLGMDDGSQTLMDQLIHKPHGIILVTGPTGSGTCRRSRHGGWSGPPRYSPRSRR